MEFYAFRVKIVAFDIEVRVAPEDEGYVDAVSPRLNFNDFPHSLITVFALLVNEDWNYVLYTYVKCANAKPLSYFYILFVVIIGNFILL
jgi:hypothetical protein